MHHEQFAAIREGPRVPEREAGPAAHIHVCVRLLQQAARLWQTRGRRATATDLPHFWCHDHRLSLKTATVSSDASKPYRENVNLPLPANKTQ